MPRKIYFCNHCGSTFVHKETGDVCPNCIEQGEEQNVLVSSNPLALVGTSYSGKTVYLATLHDQLMHSGPKWHVEVNDKAFYDHTSNYQQIRKGHMPRATTLGATRISLMNVSWMKRKLDLIMWDVAGEEYDIYVDDSNSLGRTWETLIPHCKSVLVAILCERIQGTKGDPYEEDRFLSRLFQKILRSKNRLQHVVILLIGVDVFGDSPGQVDRDALQAFNRTYRIFPGILKNVGVNVEVVPLSNIGLGNSLDKNLRLAKEPQPYNVLEPIRRIFPIYLPWWKRWIQYLRGYGEENQTNSQIISSVLDDVDRWNLELILHKTLDTRFNDNELRTLCFDLGIDYDSLGGEGKAGKARELISYFKRRDSIRKLAEAVAQRRPNIPWKEKLD